MNEVEELDIDDYQLKLFTIFNNAVLHSFDASGFQYKSDNEAHNDMKNLIEEAKAQGLL